MNQSIEIKNLDNVLQLYNKDITILEYATKKLLASGENYGSLMLELNVKLKNGLDYEKSLNIIAKMCPPNEWLKKAFNVQVTFKKEIAAYKIIFPTLRAFQKEQGISNVIDCFPECYGARISLDSKTDIVDDDAVLLLENLKQSGYEVVDRMKGFNFETIKLTVKDLAVFHAIPVAIKLLKPHTFKEKILPHLPANQLFTNLSQEVEESAINIIVKTAAANEECLPLVPAVSEALQKCLNYMKNRQPPREPFATINHNDYWVNNTMIKFENNKPTKNKIVDFQLIDYGSPANDLVFLLFSSVQQQVLNLHYDYLVNFYYDTFINTLKDFNCDVTPFTFDLFQEEINIAAKTSQIFHVLIMLRPILALKGTVTELSDMTEQDLLTEDVISNEYRQKIPEIILHFSKRGWI